MQDIKRIVKDPEKYKRVAAQKNMVIDVDRILELHAEKKEMQVALETLREKRNKNVAEIKQIKGKPPADLMADAKEIKEQIAELEPKFREVEQELFKLLSRTPMYVSADTPVGKDDSENVEVRRWIPGEGDILAADVKGNPNHLDFEFKDHITLGKDLDLLDLERGVKTAGFRGYYLKNEAALLHMGLMQYGMQLLVKHGFTPFITPTIVKTDALFGSGHFPFDEESIYRIATQRDMEKMDDEEGVTKEPKYLAGTAEPSLLNYHRGETLTEDMLPLKFCGFSPCYRGEVGSHGKDTKGIYRIHEFMKIEQVVICKNEVEAAEKYHEEMLSYSEELLQALELPYRILQICTGDMGAGKYKMYDIETWMPSRDSFGETHSASNLLDWQTRRLDIRVKGENGEKYYPFALNNTVVASPRILIAVLENYQQPDGTIKVPKVLVPFVGKEVIGK